MGADTFLEKCPETNVVVLALSRVVFGLCRFFIGLEGLSEES